MSLRYGITNHTYLADIIKRQNVKVCTLQRRFFKAKKFSKTRNSNASDTKAAKCVGKLKIFITIGHEANFLPNKAKAHYTIMNQFNDMIRTVTIPRSR